jgi:hypothetical protein
VASNFTAQHQQQAKAMGLTDQHIAQLNAAGFDWSKLGQLVQLIMSVLPQLLAMFTTPTPGPTPVQPAQQG